MLKTIITYLFIGEPINENVEHVEVEDIYTEGFADWYRYIKQTF